MQMKWPEHRPNTRLVLIAISHLRSRSVASLGQFEMSGLISVSFFQSEILSCGKMWISPKKTETQNNTWQNKEKKQPIYVTKPTKLLLLKRTAASIISNLR